MLIHPLLLGAGRRLFAENGRRAELALQRSVVSSTGVILATYAPANRNTATREEVA